MNGTRFRAVFEPYLDVTGATTVAWAVTYFERTNDLWNSDGIYSKLPDPALLLPEKFKYYASESSEWDRPGFAINSNDQTALKVRGVRFTADIDTDSKIDSSNLLVKDIDYTITVPVYNASFKDAENVTVRL